MPPKEAVSLNIHQRVIAVMKDGQYVQKVKGKAPYSVMNYDDVITMFRPLFVKHGILAIPTATSIERIEIPMPTKYKPDQVGWMTTCMIQTEFVNVDDKEDKIVVSFPGQGNDDQDKGPGKACTYGFKSAIKYLFQVRSGDDPDMSHHDYSDEPPKPTRKQLMTDITEAVRVFDLTKEQSKLIVQHHFGGAMEIKTATLEELAEVLVYLNGLTQGTVAETLDKYTTGASE